jgi:integrase
MRAVRPAARAVRKVPAEPREEVQPLSPVDLEALIAAFGGRDRAICVLAGHLGLRPMEVRLVPWRNLTEDGLIVGRARTKRAAARTRVIAVPQATMLELKRWRLESGRPDGEAPVVGEMTDRALGLWGDKKLRPAIRRIAGREATLYTLRHTHASACHYAGFTVPEAAARLGHSGQVHLGIYAHVVGSLSGRARFADLDALIADARDQRTEAAPNGEAASV